MFSVPRRIPSFLLTSLFICSAQATAAIFDRDDRRSGLPGGDASVPVGLVWGKSHWSGSGFLVDDCHVVTARHVLRRDEPVGSRVRFRLEPWRRVDRNNSSRGTVIAAGDFTSERSNLGADWAVIRLDRCLGKTFGFLPIASDLVSEAYPSLAKPALMSVGFPVDRGLASLTVDPSCAVHMKSAWGLLHDCGTLPGNSGGPLVSWNSQQKRFEARAINVAGADVRDPQPFQLSQANVAVEIRATPSLLAALEIDSR